MSSGFTEWAIQVFNTRTRTRVLDSTGLCAVLTDGSPVKATIYTTGNGQTAASNPLTFTDGWIRFWTADSVTSVDLAIQTATSHALFAESVTPSDHRVDINPEQIFQRLIIPYLVVGASEAVVNTSFTINSNMLVTDIDVDVFAVGTGAALDIGTSTAGSGFARAVSVATTGVPATLLEEAIVSGSSLYGSLLANVTGEYVRKRHMRANATSGASIIYQNTTSSSTAGSGYIGITYQRFPTR